MAEEVISISDSDEEAVPSASTSISAKTKTTLSSITNKSSIAQLLKTTQSPLQGSTTSTLSSISSGSTISSPMCNLDMNTQSSLDSGVASGVALYQPLAADLQALRQAQAAKKKRLPLSSAFPVVAEVFDKLRSAIGMPESERNLLGLIQQYISSLQYYKSHGVGKCPYRCRVLARHVTRTMFLIRDLGRHFIESPHYSQKICELLALYIFFEVRYAVEFKDSKVKIAERIIHNIHVHLENAKSNFVLRIFAFLPDMGKEHEIASKVFQRLIPEPIVIHKNEFPDRLFVQYLIAFYHWKEAWNDYEDQQKVVSFANKFMKPMSTIKTNTTYAKHLPCYTRREDATGYFLSNMVFFNDLKTASILDGIEDNGPVLVDLSQEDRITPIVDLSGATLEPIAPLLQVVKVEPRELNNGTVDLTSEEDDSWLKKLIRRAVALEVILPARLVNRKDQEGPVIELHDSDSENGIIENCGITVDANANANGDDSWAFDQRSDQSIPRLQDEVEQSELTQPEKDSEMSVEGAEVPRPEDDTESLADMFNEMNSSLDFCDDSTTESEVGRKEVQKERYQYAAQLTNSQARLTFEGVVEKELRALSIQIPTLPGVQSVGVTEVAVSKSASVAESTVAVSTPTPVLINAATVNKKPSSQDAVPAPCSESAVSDDNITVPTATVPLFEDQSSPAAVENVANIETVVEKIQMFTPLKPMAACEKSTITSDELQQEPDTVLSHAETPNREVQNSSNKNQKETPSEFSSLFTEEELRHPIVSQSINPDTENETPSTALLEMQSPKDAITYTMDPMLSSFDSSDESDEDFLGRFQQPPFKTYLRRAHRKTKKSNSKNDSENSTSENRMPCTSDEENANHASLEKTPSNQMTLSSKLPSHEDASNENGNVLFSGKVISLREDEASSGTGGVTPNYLHTPESIDVSKCGSNVVFSMQGRRLSSFPSLQMTDFDAEIALTGGEEDNNCKGDETTPRKKSFKKSIIAHSNKKQKSTQKGSDKKRAKAKSVWFAENTQVREIESRKLTLSPPKKSQSSINAISSTINKISANKQHFKSNVFSSHSTHLPTKSTINQQQSESIKYPKPNLLIKNRSNPKTTESSATTAALKSAQEKDLLQKLFPEAFAIPAKTECQIVAPKAPALIKAAITPSPPSLNLKASNANQSQQFNHRRESLDSLADSSDAMNFFNKKPGRRRKSASFSSCSEKQHSDFDKYLVRKKLLKTSSRQTATQSKSKNPATPKTEKSPKQPTKRRRKATAKLLALIADDPKLGNQMKPIVVLNRVAGPVYISFRAGLSSEKFTQIQPGVFKLQPQSPPVPSAPMETHPSPPPLVTATAAKRNPTIRTKSLSDILSDAVVQEITAAAVAAAAIPIGKGILAEDNTPTPVVPLLTDVSVDKEKQQDFCPLADPVAVTDVETTTSPAEEKEKEEEDDKREETTPVPLDNASVKSQDDMELKQIKKEDTEAKSPSPETATVNSSTKLVSDCFKKPLKSMTQKRSMAQGTTKCTQSPNHTQPAAFFHGPEFGQSSPDTSTNAQEPVTSSNSHLYPPLTSESESDSSCRTEQTGGDVESSEQSDSSQSLNLLQGRILKIKLRRLPIAQEKLIDYNLSNSIINKTKKSKASGGTKKRRGKTVAERKADSSSSSPSATAAPPSIDLDQRPPQSGLINGVLVPSIEAMNTPPPTPPTTVDDKSSVADDTSQEAKSHTASEVIDSSQPPSRPPSEVQNEKPTGSNVETLSANIIPPNVTHENLQVQAINNVHRVNLPPGHRRRFESVSLPSTNRRKRQRKKTTADTSDSDDCYSSAGSAFRTHLLKKRRKTICTDVFNPPDYSSDEETGTTKAAADSPSFNIMRMRMYEFALGSSPRPSTISSLTAAADCSSNSKQGEAEPTSVRLNNEEISESPLSNNDICDSSRLSPTNSIALKTNADSTPDAITGSDKMEEECASSCSNNRPNCDSHLTEAQKLAVSRTYSKNNMVQQVFVPPEIELFIEEPVTLGVAKKNESQQPTASNIVSTSTSTTTTTTRVRKTKTKSRKRFKTSDEEEEDKHIRDKDRKEEKVRKVTKQIKKGRKKGTGAIRGKRQ